MWAYLFHQHLIWNKEITLKFSLFVWRLLHNRIPTKDNLHGCGILQHHSQFCTNGCGLEKLAGHLFLSCPHFGWIWLLLRQWLGISSLDPLCLSDHSLQYSQIGENSKSLRSVLNLILFSYVWVIWKERNNIILYLVLFLKKKHLGQQKVIYLINNLD